MKRETILKVILVLVIGITLLINPVKAFAADGATNLDELWKDYEDQGSKDQLTGDTQQTTGEQKEEEKTQTTPSTPSTPSTTTPSTTPNTQTTKPNEELPKAGLVEDTMMVVAIAVLGITAVYTFKKVNEYNNI